MVIALVVTPQGFPLAYEVMPGNTSDKTTVKDFLAQIEAQYGRSDRVWIMDRGIPTEETLEQMRTGDSPVHYLVGTPKGRLSTFEKKFLALPWQAVRPSVDVKLVLAPIKMRQFIFTHTSGPVPRHAVLGVGGCPITRGRGSARGLVQCRRGRTAEQREPVVDPLSGQALVSTGPLVPSPAPRAQIEPGAEQVEKALSGALVDVEIGA